MTKQTDFKGLEDKFPNRNWREIARRMEAGEPVATSLKEAIERYTTYEIHKE